MRILVLNHEYPPVGGGGGKACQDIAEELARRGHGLVILTSYFRGLPREEKTAGVRVIRLNAMRREQARAGLVTMKMYILGAFVKGLSIIRSWKPELIHVHFAVPAGAAAYLLNRITGIPYVITAHLGDIPGGSPHKTAGWFRVIYPLTRAVWMRASGVTTVSSFTAELIREHYQVQPTVIPNGITVRGQRELPGHTPPVILFAGRFVEQKNLTVFMDVMEKLRDHKWTCVMLGDGPLRAEVMARIDRSGLKECFSLPGWVSPQFVSQHMDQSDILFMPSLYEGLPVVGVQALDAGLAIVASNVGGFNDVVEQGKNGFLCPPQDRDGFCESLTSLLSNGDALQQARKHSLRVAEKFEIQRVVDEYEKVFLSIVHQD